MSQIVVTKVQIDAIEQSCKHTEKYAIILETHLHNIGLVYKREYLLTNVLMKQRCEKRKQKLRSFLK